MHAALRHEAVGQQQLHGVVHRIEHARQARGQLAALAQQQVAEQRLVAAGLLQLHHARGVHALDLHVERLVDAPASRSAPASSENMRARLGR